MPDTEQVDELNRVIEILEDDKAGLESQGDSLRRQVEDLRETVEDLKGKLAELREQQPRGGGGGSSTITDGTWRVGSEIRSGLYRTVVPGGSNALCYWARLRNFTGGLNSIIDNGLEDGGDTATVEILATDVGFESNDCGTWTRIG